MVNHGHGKKVNIPSYLVKPGEVITFKDKSRDLPKIKDVLEGTGSKVIPKWLDLDKNTATAKVLSLAAREDIDLELQETLIVELYSK
ncbi:30S ribosomal protein S4 [bioreactor metagenome]|uniref:30S ribosomal protein S4 n=1 Tax=bioreactor metagenome TaxID=1076179 RepID=A0A645J721_9ZZZZ